MAGNRKPKFVVPGDLVLDFYQSSAHQGHVGVVLDGNGRMEGGWNGPGMNRIYTIAQSASVTGYDVRIPRDAWINYEGDEAGFAKVA
jgi:hypothetical protein